MSLREGSFVWYELMTNNASAAQDFYTRVVGWNVADSGMPNMHYTLFKVGDHPVAGMMEIPPQAQDWPVAWMAHILTADLDATVERVKQAGGALHKPPTDIPGIGRFAVVADPQGAVFLLFQGNGPPPPGLAPATQGAIGWHELHTTDWQAAFTFYQTLFGWEKSQSVDMGPMGTYQTFNINGVWAGGMMNNPQVPQPGWLTYINVDNIDAAAARLTEAGGQLVQGPMQVPGGSWIVQARDPQGVIFALVAPGG